MQNVIDSNAFEKYLEERIAEYKEMTISDLKLKFNMKSNAKNINSMLISKMMNLSNLELDSLLFLKKNYVFKTVTVTSKNKVTESMSFPAIDYFDMLKNDWSNSITCNYFTTKTFLIFIFRKNEEDSYLVDYISMKFNKEDVYNILLVWEKVKSMISNNQLIIGGKNGFSVENFPKKNENDLVHVRPHDTDSTEGKILLPNGKRILNYCFWLNNTYIEKVINERGILNEKIK